MSRRNWIKIYPEGFLRRTLFEELLPIERWVWIGFLCLAGDNALDGKICIANDMGYTDEQLAKLLDIDTKTLKISKEKMIKFEKISVDKNNVIQILSWNIYQSEYQRQRDYREEYKKRMQREVTTQSYNAKLHIDRDRDIDKEEDNIKKENVALELSEYLYKKILENNPEHKEPNLNSWSKHIDLMIRLDKRNPDKIKEVIDWCQADNFWYKNILSTAKLREKYDQLILNMKGNSAKPKKHFASEREYTDEERKRIEDKFYS